MAHHLLLLIAAAGMRLLLLIAVARVPLLGCCAAGECCSADDMIKSGRQMQFIKRYLHTMAVRRVDRDDVWISAGFFRSRARVGGASKMEANACLYLILRRRADADAATSRRRRDDRHKLLSQRPRRFDGLLQVPEEERRVGAADDAVVARQGDHHAFFDAHAR